MTNSIIVCTVKMEYGWNFSISGLKMMLKSGLEKIFLKFLHAQAIFRLIDLLHKVLRKYISFLSMKQICHRQKFFGLEL